MSDTQNGTPQERVAPATTAEYARTERAEQRGEHTQPAPQTNTSPDATPATPPGGSQDERAWELRAIQAITDVALSHLALDRLLPDLLDRLCSVLSVDNAAILLPTDDQRSLVLYLAHGPEEAVIGQVRIPIGEGVAGRIAATREPVIIDDLSAADVANPFLREHLRSLVGVPLLLEDRLLGVLHVATVAAHHFGESDVRVLRLAADRIALAIDHARLYAEAEAARREAQALSARLSAVIDAVPCVLTLHDAQGRLVQLNAVARALAPDLADLAARSATRAGEPGQVSVEDLAEALGLRTVSGALVPPVEQPLARALRGEQVSAVEMRRILPDGQTRDLLVSAAPLYDANGHLDGVLSISQDVTALRTAERQAMERAHLLETTIEAIADGIFIYDANGGILRTNEAVRQLFALDKQPDYVTRTLEERIPAVETRDAQGNPLAPEDWPQRRILRGEVLAGEHTADYLLRVLDGREVMINVSGSPMRAADGQIVGGILVLRDVTTLRHLERRTHEALDALLEMAHALVLPEASADAPATAPAEVARRLAVLTRGVLGCDRVGIRVVDPETLILRPFAIVGLSAEQERAWWVREEAQQTRPSDQLDSAIGKQLAAGRAVPLDLTRPPYNLLPNPYSNTTVLVVPMMVGETLLGMLTIDFGGERHEFTPEEIALSEAVARLAALVIDRERLQREWASAQANELALITINQRMDEFLGMAAHDLKTPVAGSKLSAQVAARRVARMVAQIEAGQAPSSDPVREVGRALELVESSMDRLARLVDRLLDVSRIRTGKLVLHREACDLAQIVRQAVEEQRLLAPTRAITLTLPDDTGTTVEADPDRIGQVVSNFLTNALRYSPEDKSIEVTIAATPERVRVAVRDEGPGIPPAKQETIWQRFEQAPSAPLQAGSETGLGLGLYISREILLQHGGAIGVESVPGKGSTFWFTLPSAPTSGTREDAR